MGAANIPSSSSVRSITTTSMPGVCCSAFYSRAPEHTTPHAINLPSLLGHTWIILDGMKSQWYSIKKSWKIHSPRCYLNRNSTKTMAEWNLSAQQMFGTGSMLASIDPVLSQRMCWLDEWDQVTSICKSAIFSSSQSAGSTFCAPAHLLPGRKNVKHARCGQRWRGWWEGAEEYTSSNHK